MSFNLSNVGENSGLNTKGQYLRLQKEKENFCVVFTYTIKRAREIRRFDVAVVQRRLRNVQKNVMHVQSGCFANNNNNRCLNRVTPSATGLVSTGAL